MRELEVLLVLLRLFLLALAQLLLLVARHLPGLVITAWRARPFAPSDRSTTPQEDRKRDIIFHMLLAVLIAWFVLSWLLRRRNVRPSPPRPSGEPDPGGEFPGPALAKYCAKQLHSELRANEDFHRNIATALENPFLRMDVMLRHRSAGKELSKYDGDDLRYKDNALAIPDQAATSFPEVHTEARIAGTKFLVIACDGIWDCMTDQEVTDCIQIYTNDVKPAAICVHLPDHCLSLLRGIAELSRADCLAARRGSKHRSGPNHLGTWPGAQTALLPEVAEGGAERFGVIHVTSRGGARLGLEPQFDRPYLSTSQQENFWVRCCHAGTWNLSLSVSTLFRQSNVCTAARGDARVFLCVGAHARRYVHPCHARGKRRPSSALHGACAVAEAGGLVGGARPPRAVATTLMLAFVLVTESEAMVAFVRDTVGWALGSAPSVFSISCGICPFNSCTNTTRKFVKKKEVSHSQMT
ncbi:hypothetical protein PR202_gb15258 [Eleusine coracana subsp. coracana]|uniref:protein-serine/threonine phosphatase n=1 Tax=Eleusine coracana subsp. coracana TaxID=191504 RepID=A0AAV5EV24_ELECO|nr:hypothetical protein PR202_gb15258 [Eleusine coracana subsp. coracana]